jgi:predicted aspartyl protease
VTAARWVALLAFAASVTAPPSARADELPSAEQLAARSRIALGAERRPDSERETWSVRAGGLEGSLETVRRAADMASTTTLGPFRTARGTVRGERWHQNENGETILDRAEPSQIERVAAQSVVRVRQPIDAWEVATTFASGHVTRTFYDPRTDYVIRTEHTVAGHTTHVIFDDFRTDARGRTRAWHYSGGDEHPENDYEYRLIREDDAPEVSDAEVAIPHDRRTLVEFPAGSDVVRLPARVVRDRIYVRLQIGRRGLDFLLDTGAAALTIDDAVAQELGLSAYGRTSQTVAGTFETRRVVAPLIALGPLAMHDVVLRTAPFSQHEAPDTRVVGLLGFDFIDALGLKIDYAAGTVDAYRQSTLQPPPGVPPLEIRLNTGAPVGRVTVGEATGDDFILDTGAAFSFVLFQRFAHAHPEAFAPVPGSRVNTGSGVGGALAYRTVVCKRLTVGTAFFDNAVGAETTSPSALGFDNEDGLIGSDILKLFTVYVDYAAGRIFLAPRGRAPGPAKSRRPAPASG